MSSSLRRLRFVIVTASAHANARAILALGRQGVHNLGKFCLQYFDPLLETGFGVNGADRLESDVELGGLGSVVKV